MRILALTRNASLLVALGSMMREWEVVSASDVGAASEVEPGSAVALIDLGPTKDGLTAATELYQQGVTIPCVVLGDEPAEASNAFVLVRPFSLEDLATAVTDASTRAPVAQSAPASPSTALPAERPSAPETPRAPDGSEARPERNGVTAIAPAVRSEPTWGSERPASPPHETPAKPQKTRPFTVVPPAESEESPRPVAAPPAAPAGEKTEAPAPPPRAAEPPEPVAPRPPAASAPEPGESTTAELEEPADLSETVARIEAELAPARDEPVAPPQTPQPPLIDPPQPQPRAPAASSAATAPDLVEQPTAQGRWRLRRKPATRTGGAVDFDPAESPLVRQLKKAAKNAEDLETLVDELPFLADLGSLADGLVAEVDSQFSAQVASVFVRSEDGYHAVAHRGLSHVESGMVVPETQPLFSDVIQTGEGILIQPVDLAQGLVAGIGGARTEAIMAVPAVVHGACVAIIVVGRERFSEADLDGLSDLASEAAPGLAVSLALRRLRERI